MNAYDLFGVPGSGGTLLVPKDQTLYIARITGIASTDEWDADALVIRCDVVDPDDGERYEDELDAGEIASDASLAPFAESLRNQGYTVEWGSE